MQQTADILSVSRREVKYLVSLPDRLYLLRALDQLLIPDAYGGYRGYSVRSVYFDSICNEDYEDKVRGAPIKKRIRLRIYHAEDRTAKFELKRKEYGQEKKESLIVSRDQAQRILGGDYRPLLEQGTGLGRYAYDLMTTRRYRPVSLIAYDRRAYTHPQFSTRVTLDQNLRCSNTQLDLFCPHLHLREILPRDETILELKYDRFLFAQLQNVLSRCDLSRRPPSKFGSSRDLLQRYYA